MKFDGRVIVKLVIWSFVVGFVLYSLDWTPSDVFGWLFESFSGFWDWVSGTGIQYVLTGAAIVVPFYLIRQLSNRKKNTPSEPPQQPKD